MQLFQLRQNAGASPPRGKRATEIVVVQSQQPELWEGAVTAPLRGKAAAKIVVGNNPAVTVNVKYGSSTIGCFYSCTFKKST